ncbi:MAG: hypothetical protein ACQERZ_02600 [Fusobacteriota bacterium]
MENIRIVGIVLENRIEDATELQSILTKYGCNIRTRLGIHEVTDKECPRDGLIILELVGQKSSWLKMEAELLKLDGVKLKNMDFEL